MNNNVSIFEIENNLNYLGKINEQQFPYVIETYTLIIYKIKQERKNYRIKKLPAIWFENCFAQLNLN